jgi:hypothetical protein
MLPVFANLNDVTAELVAYDGGGQVAAVGNALVVAALNSSLVAGHAQAIGNNADTDTVRANVRQLDLVQTQIHLTVDSNSFCIHNKFLLN